MGYAGHTAPATDPDASTDWLPIRYLTLGGAHVHVTASPTREHDYAWRCHGCGKGLDATFSIIDNARTTANTHAATCRALPRPGPAITDREAA
jgi:hypothetical protein